MAQVKCPTCNGTGWIEQLDADALDYLRRYHMDEISSRAGDTKSYYRRPVFTIGGNHGHDQYSHTGRTSPASDQRDVRVIFR